MAVRNKKVLINVDMDFFRNTFEPARERIQKKLGVRVSQINFTRMLFKNKIDLTPKLNFNLNDDISLRNLKVKNKSGRFKNFKKK